MCQPCLSAKAGEAASRGLELLRVVDAQSHPVFRDGKEPNKNGAGSTQRLWRVFGSGRLCSLRFGGGATGFGALDALLFGGATAPDVRLHPEYNLMGGHDLQSLVVPGSTHGPMATGTQ